MKIQIQKFIKMEASRLDLELKANLPRTRGSGDRLACSGKLRTADGSGCSGCVCATKKKKEEKD